MSKYSFTNILYIPLFGSYFAIAKTKLIIEITNAVIEIINVAFFIVDIGKEL